MSRIPTIGRTILGGVAGVTVFIADIFFTFAQLCRARRADEGLLFDPDTGSSAPSSCRAHRCGRTADPGGWRRVRTQARADVHA